MHRKVNGVHPTDAQIYHLEYGHESFLEFIKEHELPHDFMTSVCIDVNCKISQKSQIDNVIKTYADRLEEIYNKKLAGDHTFSGILSEFLEELISSCTVVETLGKRHRDRFHRQKH